MNHPQQQQPPPQPLTTTTTTTKPTATKQVPRGYIRCDFSSSLILHFYYYHNYHYIIIILNIITILLFLLVLSSSSLSLSLLLSSLSSSSSLHCLSLSSHYYQHLHFFVVSLRGPWVKKLSLSSSSSLIGLRKREYSLCGRDRRDFSNGTKVSAPYFLFLTHFTFLFFLLALV